MLESFILFLGVALIIAVVLGVGLFSLLILVGVFVILFYVTKTLFWVVLLMLLLASPFIAMEFLIKLCQGRTLPGTQWPLGKTVIIAILLAVILSILSFGHSFTTIEDFINDAHSMMEQCDKDGDQSTDMVIGHNHYHFSCHHDTKPAIGL